MWKNANTWGDATARCTHTKRKTLSLIILWRHLTKLNNNKIQSNWGGGKAGAYSTVICVRMCVGYFNLRERIVAFSFQHNGIARVPSLQLQLVPGALRGHRNDSK